MVGFRPLAAILAVARPVRDAMYTLFALLLTATYLVKTKDDRSEQRLAILYFAFVYCLTGLLWRLGFQAETNEVYFAIMGSASFLLIVLYHSLYMTPALFACALLEVWQIIICALGAYGVSWATGRYVDIAAACNYLALAILAWSWADGNGTRGRRVYSRLVDPAWLGLPSLDRLVARYSEKVKVPW